MSDFGTDAALTGAAERRGTPPAPPMLRASITLVGSFGTPWRPRWWWTRQAAPGRCVEGGCTGGCRGGPEGDRSVDLLDGADLAGDGAELPVVGVIVLALAALVVAALAVLFVIPALSLRSASTASPERRRSITRFTVLWVVPHRAAAPR